MSGITWHCKEKPQNALFGDRWRTPYGREYVLTDYGWQPEMATLS